MKLKRCPFCGKETGRSSTLCGDNGSGKWWCKNQDYTVRTPDPSAQKVIEAAIRLTKAEGGGDTYALALANLRLHDAVIEYQKETP